MNDNIAGPGGGGGMMMQEHRASLRGAQDGAAYKPQSGSRLDNKNRGKTPNKEGGAHRSGKSSQ